MDGGAVDLGRVDWNGVWTAAQLDFWPHHDCCLEAVAGGKLGQLQLSEDG